MASSEDHTVIRPLHGALLQGLLEEDGDGGEEDDAISSSSLADFCHKLVPLVDDSSTSSPRLHHNISESAVLTRRMPKRSASIPVRDGCILRERQRRNDMASKFSLLESLLPSPKSRRDRTAIVEDTIHLVLQMRAKLQEVEGLKLVNPQASLIFSNGMRQADCVTDATRPCQEEAVDDKLWSASFSQTPTLSCNCLPKIGVHMMPDSQILITITSELQPAFLTRTLAAMEELDLDVSSCNMCKAPSEISCIMLSKLREPYPAGSITANKIAEVMERVLSSST